MDRYRLFSWSFLQFWLVSKSDYAILDVAGFETHSGVRSMNAICNFAPFTLYMRSTQVVWCNVNVSNYIPRPFLERVFSPSEDEDSTSKGIQNHCSWGTIRFLALDSKKYNIITACNVIGNNTTEVESPYWIRKSVSSIRLRKSFTFYTVEVFVFRISLIYWYLI